MLIKPKAGQPAKIKVVGVGGGGGNAVSSMMKEEDIAGVEFIVLNTDAQALLHHEAHVKVQIGESLTKGLGSGGDPEIGAKAAEESSDKIKEALRGADMIFIACGEGGGTGTGSAPYIAQIGKEVGALTVAVVTKPFDFEGSKRQFVADEGVSRLKDHVDTLIVIPNQRVLQVIDHKVSVMQAFKKIDSILHQGVKGIAELITTPGLINVDFADVRAIMSNAGTALMGIGSGTGEKRIVEAIKQAIASPLLEISIEGAKGVLFNVMGGPDLLMSEIDEAASLISKTVDPNADIIFGAVVEEKMMDQVKIIVVATKFDEARMRLLKMKSQSSSQREVFKSGVTMENTEKNPPQSYVDPSSDVIDDQTEFDMPAFLRKKTL